MNIIANQLPPFDVLDPKNNIQTLEQTLADAKQRIDTLAAQSTPTWESLMLPLAEIDESISRLWSPVSHLHSVCDTESIRPVYEQGVQIMTQWGTWIAGHQDLFKAIQALSQSASFKDLSEPQQTAITNTLRDFKLAGSALEGADKKRFAEIKMRLAELGTLFSQHVLDATQAFTLHIEDKNKLAGLPESAIDAAAQRAQDDGNQGYLFTLDIPSYLPLMQYLDDSNIRETMYKAYVTRASEGELDNTPVIEETLKLRKEMAQLLGFDSYADYSLADKMASSVDEVSSFLRDLAHKSKKMAKKDLKELRNFAENTLNMQKLEAWDIPYASEKLRQEKYAISQDELKPWFPESYVKQGMFTLAEKLYGIQIVPADSPVWHENVCYYDVLDKQGNKKAGFYLDPYARKGKRGGAWMDEALVSWRFADNTLQHPVAYLVCNFDAPVGNKPALWTHDEVITLFHEFGHGLHHMMTAVDVREVSGINGVPWDAVELPSQFMENFCWEREVLDLFAKHYETGEPLPQAMFEKMTAAKNFQSAMQMLRQIEFSLFDLLLHTDFDPEGEQTVQDKLDEIRAEVSVLTPPSFNKFQNSFSHIFAGGYAAGYFSYKWAEVLSADAYAAFEEASLGKSIINTEVASQFLDEVLSRGGSRDMMQSYQSFRGKAPTVDALLKHNGIQTN
ncbi:M3 family metallopeptidase [Ghiorsea bivora]|uniref:M3 family metallopeptidase n=1 Tax=Ghiorsea bivora TaxID=1485545 RepID=UPI0009DE1B4E|nr:M3 family metallopeptidase [Ghiorsea bivora]